MMDFNYNTDAELQPQRSGLLSQVAQRLQENPEAARALTPELETKIVGSPLTPEERAEVAPTAAGAAAITLDKQRGLSPQQSIMQTLQEGNKRLADEKAKLYEAEASGKPLTRGQMVALAMLAMAPLIGRAAGGNMGGVAGGEGAMVAGKLMLGQEQGRQAREEKRVDARADAIDRQMLANDKAALEMQTLPLKAKIQQDAILDRKVEEGRRGIRSGNITNVEIKAESELAKKAALDVWNNGQSLDDTRVETGKLTQFLEGAYQRGTIKPDETIADAVQRAVTAEVLPASDAALFERTLTDTILRTMSGLKLSPLSDRDVALVMEARGRGVTVPAQVAKYLMERSLHTQWVKQKQLYDRAGKTGAKEAIAGLDPGQEPYNPDREYDALPEEWKQIAEGKVRDGTVAKYRAAGERYSSEDEARIQAKMKELSGG